MPRKKPTPPVEPEPKKVGGFRFHELGVLVSENPAEACTVLRAQLDACGGNKSAAARAQKTTYRTICRWIEQLVARGFDPQHPAS